jgi:uncharacterized Zn finger protein (UPF0148 family)
MTADAYLRVSCPNCESQFAVDYLLEEVNGNVEYCPFCGDEMPNEEEQEDLLEEDEEETEDASW